jgi:hypothetical protein
MSSPAATKRSKSDLAERPLQPIHVRIAGAARAGRKDRLIIVDVSLPRRSVCGIVPCARCARWAGRVAGGAGRRRHGGWHGRPARRSS